MRTQIIFLAFLTISFNGFAVDMSLFNAEGIFSIWTQSNRTASITLFDIDNHGDFHNYGFLDLKVGDLGSKNSIYFGNKSLNFKGVYDFKIEHSTLSIKVTDLNKDGYLDIVEGNSEERNYVYLGPKNGKYIENGLSEDLKDDTYNGLGYAAVPDLNT